jgi:hypothetical protein
MAGLDPASIFPKSHFLMDARVKPAHDLLSARGKMV